jgi:DNA-binding transcriptional regulator YiaG
LYTGPFSFGPKKEVAMLAAAAKAGVNDNHAMAQDTRVEPMYKKLGERIKEIREEKEIPLGQFAEQAGIGRSMLGHMEAGRSRIMLHQFLRIAKTLGKSPGFLLKDLEP